MVPCPEHEVVRALSPRASGVRPTGVLASDAVDFLSLVTVLAGIIGVIASAIGAAAASNVSVLVGRVVRVPGIAVGLDRRPAEEEEPLARVEKLIAALSGSIRRCPGD